MVSGLDPAVAAPATVAAAAELLRGAGPPVVFVGGGTKQTASAAPSSAHLTISTASLKGVVLHDPLDGVVIVRAGTPLADLQAELAPHGQWLAVDPPFENEGATVGGIFSANDAGPRRLAFGTLRDLVIGATVVTGDGIVAHSGGRVIKNVAGFDLARLYCGAFGTLGLVAELALRLHPRRPASQTITVACPVDRLLELSGAIASSGLTPTAVDWLMDPLGASGAGEACGSPGALLARFEERTERATSAQASDLLSLCEARRFDAAILENEAERTAWEAVDTVLAGTADDTVVRAVTRVTRVAEAACRLQELAVELTADCAFVSHALVGVHTARLRGGGHGAVVSAWRSAIELLGGHVTVHRFAPSSPEATASPPAPGKTGERAGPPGGSAGQSASVDRWGEPPDAVALMRQVKRELDPHNRCAPGSFVGGI